MSVVRAGAATDNMGAVRALDPGQVERLRRLRGQGVPVPALAGMFGIGTRTIHRYLADERAVATVVLGDWEAQFLVGDERQPLRVSTWRIRPLDPAEGDALTRQALIQEDERDGG